jgi:ABC-type lipopolysaccharide export system ATPase subunit
MQGWNLRDSMARDGSMIAVSACISNKKKNQRDRGDNSLRALRLKKVTVVRDCTVSGHELNSCTLLRMLRALPDLALTALD